MQVQISAQIGIEFNANLDLESSYMSENSHYWKNEIHANSTGFSLDIPELNLISKVSINEQWKVNARLWVFREFGKRPGILKEIDTYTPTLAQLNLQWTSKSRKSKITIGRFNNGYGNFIRKQTSNQRNFVFRPLFYSFFVNASDEIGVAPGLGEQVRLRVGERLAWGSIPFYYGGYSNGINYKYGQEGTTTYSLSIVTGTPNKLSFSDTPLSPTLITRIGWQPNYASKIGWSMMYGSFMRNIEAVSFNQINQYRQFVTGFDFEYGKGFFEISGELNAFYYNLPSIDLQSEEIEFHDGIAHLFGVSPYMDVKYENPIVSGFYAAIRIETMLFYNAQNKWEHSNKWEENIYRIGAGIGYKISKNLQFRVNADFQRHFENNEAIDRTGIRTMLTLFI